jgi:hypothetical protein
MNMLAAFTCEFLLFRNENDVAYDELEPPFQDVVEGYVGIYRYNIVESEVVDGETDGCVGYEEMTFGDASYAVLTTAQWCALFAPVAAAIALFLTFTETCVCNCYGSSIFAGILYVVAAGCQAATFAIFGEKDFWYVQLMNRMQKGGLAKTLRVLCSPLLQPLNLTSWLFLY